MSVQPLRKTSTVADFPFLDPRMVWVLIMEGEPCTVLNPHGSAQRLDAVTLVQQGAARLFIGWPGKWRSDLFEVDEPERLEEIQSILSTGQKN